MLEFLGLLFQRRGIEVVGACGGKAGLEIVESTPPDLILLDIMMLETKPFGPMQLLESVERVLGRKQ